MTGEAPDRAVGVKSIPFEISDIRPLGSGELENVPISHERRLDPELGCMEIDETGEDTLLVPFREAMEVERLKERPGLLDREARRILSLEGKSE